jgi:hypothetical protein
MVERGRDMRRDQNDQQRYKKCVPCRGRPNVACDFAIKLGIINPGKLPYSGLVGADVSHFMRYRRKSRTRSILSHCSQRATAEMILAFASSLLPLVSFWAGQAARQPDPDPSLSG